MCAPSGSKTLANMSEIFRHKNVILITMNGENLGPNAAKHGPKPCTMAQNKARRTNKIDFLQLPWAQEVRGSNPRAPTTYFFQFSLLDAGCAEDRTWVHLRPNASLSTLSTVRRCTSGIAGK